MKTKRTVVYGINNQYALDGVAFANQKAEFLVVDTIVDNIDKVKALTILDADVIIVCAQPDIMEEAEIAVDIEQHFAKSEIEVQLIK